MSPTTPADAADTGDGDELDEAVDPSAVAAALAAAVEALGGEHRPGQVEMAEAVAATLAGAGHLLVQAGTGTGKSLAYLVPAVLHATSPEKRVVVATATLALQHQLVSRDLPRLADALEPVLGRRPTYAVLKGRHNYVCLERLNREAGADDSDDDALFAAPTTALGKQAKALRAWVDETETGDRDDLPEPVDGRVWRGVSVSGRECVGAAKCMYGEQCFAEAARHRAAESQVVITNHAMLAIHTLDQVPLLPDHDAVVVDEGHELVDRATTAVTDEISGSAVHRAASRTKRLVDAALADRLDDAAEALEIELAARAEGLFGPVRIEKVEGTLLLALAAVRDSTHAAITALAKDASSKDSDPESLATLSRARGLLGEMHDVAGKLLELDDSVVAWLDPGDRRTPTVRIAPLTVAGLLRSELFDESRVVITSATLQLGGSFAPLALSFGLPTDGTRSASASWTGLDVGSPFDHGRQGILYVATSVPPPGRDGTDVKALDELGDLIAAAGGRTLALFSSWRGVERASEHLAEALPDKLLDRGIVPPDVQVLVQKRGDSVADLVSRFAADPRSVLLGTLSLWQGVDVPGESCNLVVIDRIPFPRPDDPLVAARSKHAEDEGGNGFTQVSVPRAALLLAQGVGRLIRSSSDRGVVAVLDPRLATARYGDFLRKSLPPFWFTTDGDLVRQSLTRLDELASAD
ncbi:MAG TPA: ATP-dependent DNA helicase [Candidatus Nanopelagicales bacterium]|nr:ATP-dependent DNA helicase [Candidatus Nanopelagicales bacterium]